MTGDLGRLSFLAGLGATSASALLPGSALGQGSGPIGSNWIDVHNHYAVPEWEAVLTAAGVEPPPMKGWSPAKAVAQLDASGVAAAMTCAITYLVSRLEWGLKGGAIHDNAVMARYARMCNEAGAELVSAYPGRFGLFAVLPLPFDIEGSLAEIAYAFDTLKAKGIALCTSYGDTWLGDPIFAPIFEELNRRKAVVFVHPTVPTCCVSLVPRINYTVVEYGADTTRTIMSLIVSGASQKYTDCRFIFTHGGGVMPFLIERVLGTRRSGETETMAQIFGPSQQPGSPMYELRRFHYDTAAVYNPASMSALVQVVGIPRIVFGTDYPYGDMPVIAKYMHQCNLSAPDLQAIGRTNALAFLPA